MMEQEHTFEELDLRSRMRERQKKRRRKVALVLLVVFLIFGIVIVPILNGPALKDGETVTVQIDAGSSTMDIASALKEHGVISSRMGFVASVWMSQYRGDLRYGTFEFHGDMSMKEIIKTLSDTGASRPTVTVTIPEGYSVEMMINRFVENGLGTKEDYEAALKKSYDFEFIKHIPKPEGQRYFLQGFLFPSTYEFYTTATAEDVVKTLLAEFEKQYKTVSDDFSDVYEVVNKAALVQRESKLASEDARIAGVIENRLKKDMRLQIDATVVYAMSEGLYNVDRVLYEDLELDSPYNTYKNKGLPIGPICNPGLAAIQAAKNPETHRYLYYHTDEEKKDGSHIFSETFAQHQNTR